MLNKLSNIIWIQFQILYFFISYQDKIKQGSLTKLDTVPKYQLYFIDKINWLINDLKFISGCKPWNIRIVSNLCFSDCIINVCAQLHPQKVWRQMGNGLCHVLLLALHCGSVLSSHLHSCSRCSCYWIWRSSSLDCKVCISHKSKFTYLIWIHSVDSSFIQRCTVSLFVKDFFIWLLYIIWI